MSATKAVGTNALSAVTTTQSTTANSIGTQYAAEWSWKAVVSSSPSTAATFQVSWSLDGTLYYYGALMTLPTTNGTYWGVYALPVTAQYSIVTFTAGTAGDCAFSAQLGEAY